MQGYRKEAGAEDAASTPTKPTTPTATRIIVLTLIAVAMLAYAGPLFLGDTFGERDHLIHTVPAKTFAAKSLRSGSLPEWWGGVGLGVPFAANPNHSALYPGVWPVAILPMPWAVDFLLVMHLALAGIGIAFLSRRFGADAMGAIVAGAAFMLSGFATSTVVHGGPLFTLAWTPWIGWAADRLALAPTDRSRVRCVGVLALLQGVQLLAGDPSFVIISALFAFAVTMIRADSRLRATALLAAAYAGALVLSAVVIIPALHLLPETSRAAAANSQQFGVWSMHPARMIEWVWPAVFGDPNVASHNLARAVADSSTGARGLGTGWCLGLYIGLPTLLLAAYGVARAPRRMRWFAAVAAAFVVLSLGRYTPIYGVFHTIFLPQRLVRYPEKHAMGALVTACVFAGIGFTTLMRAPLSRRAALVSLSVCGTFCALVASAALFRDGIADWLTGKSARLWPSLDVDSALGSAIASGWTAVAVVVSFAAAVYLSRKKQNRVRAGYLVAAIVVGDLVLRSWALLPLVDRNAIKEPPQILASVVGKLGHTPRLFRPQMLARTPAKGEELETNPAIERHDTGFANSATRFGFSYLLGYDQATSRRLFRLWHAGAASGARMLDLFGVDYAILPTHAARAANMTVIARNERGDVALVRIDTSRPRAFITSSWRWLPNDEAVFDALFRGPPSLQRGLSSRSNTVHLIGSGVSPAPLAEPQPIIECTLRSRDTQHVEITCDSSEGGYVVLLDSWAPGWTATVDGVPARVERADVLARAVKVAPGEHLVVFRYRTPGLYLGAWISLLGWLGLFSLFYLLRTPRPPGA